MLRSEHKLLQAFHYFIAKSSGVVAFGLALLLTLTTWAGSAAAQIDISYPTQHSLCVNGSGNPLQNHICLLETDIENDNNGRHFLTNAELGQTQQASAPLFTEDTLDALSITVASGVTFPMLVITLEEPGFASAADITTIWDLTNDSPSYYQASPNEASGGTGNADVIYTFTGGTAPASVAEIKEFLGNLRISMNSDEIDDVSDFDFGNQRDGGLRFVVRLEITNSDGNAVSGDIDYQLQATDDPSQFIAAGTNAVLDPGATNPGGLYISGEYGNDDNPLAIIFAYQTRTDSVTVTSTIGRFNNGAAVTGTSGDREGRVPPRSSNNFESCGSAEYLPDTTIVAENFFVGADADPIENRDLGSGASAGVTYMNTYTVLGLFTGVATIECQIGGEKVVMQYRSVSSTNQPPSADPVTDLTFTEDHANTVQQDMDNEEWALTAVIFENASDGTDEGTLEVSENTQPWSFAANPLPSLPPGVGAVIDDGSDTDPISITNNVADGEIAITISEIPSDWWGDIKFRLRVTDAANAPGVFGDAQSNVNLGDITIEVTPEKDDVVFPVSVISAVSEDQVENGQFIDLAESVGTVELDRRSEVVEFEIELIAENNADNRWRLDFSNVPNSNPIAQAMRAGSGRVSAGDKTTYSYSGSLAATDAEAAIEQLLNHVRVGYDGDEFSHGAVAEGNGQTNLTVRIWIDEELRNVDADGNVVDLVLGPGEAAPKFINRILDENVQVDHVNDPPTFALAANSGTFYVAPYVEFDNSGGAAIDGTITIYELLNREAAGYSADVEIIASVDNGGDVGQADPTITQNGDVNAALDDREFQVAVDPASGTVAGAVNLALTRVDRSAGAENTTALLTLTFADQGGDSVTANFRVVVIEDEVRPVLEDIMGVDAGGTSVTFTLPAAYDPFGQCQDIGKTEIPCLYEEGDDSDGNDRPDHPDLAYTHNVDYEIVVERVPEAGDNKATPSRTVMAPAVQGGGSLEQGITDDLQNQTVTLELTRADLVLIPGDTYQASFAVLDQDGFWSESRTVQFTMLSHRETDIAAELTAAGVSCAGTEDSDGDGVSNDYENTIGTDCDGNSNKLTNGDFIGTQTDYEAVLGQLGPVSPVYTVHIAHDSDPSRTLVSLDTSGVGCESCEVQEMFYVVSDYSDGSLGGELKTDVCDFEPSEVACRFTDSDYLSVFDSADVLLPIGHSLIEWVINDANGNQHTLKQHAYVAPVMILRGIDDKTVYIGNGGTSEPIEVSFEYELASAYPALDVDAEGAPYYSLFVDKLHREQTRSNPERTISTECVGTNRITCSVTGVPGVVGERADVEIDRYRAGDNYTVNVRSDDLIFESDEDRRFIVLNDLLVRVREGAESRADTVITDVAVITQVGSTAARTAIAADRRDRYYNIRVQGSATTWTQIAVQASVEGIVTDSKPAVVVSGEFSVVFEDFSTRTAGQTVTMSVYETDATGALLYQTDYAVMNGRPREFTDANNNGIIDEDEIEVTSRGVISVGFEMGRRIIKLPDGGELQIQVMGSVAMADIEGNAIAAGSVGRSENSIQIGAGASVGTPSGYDGEGVHDFVATIDEAAGRAYVVIGLLKPLRVDQAYYKYDDANGWSQFVTNADNAFYSAQGRIMETNGNQATETLQCPKPFIPSNNAVRTLSEDEAANFWRGDGKTLAQGHQCVLLVIEDGGPNDNDPVKDRSNRLVFNLGAPGASSSVPDDDDSGDSGEPETIGGASGSGGGGSADLWTLLLLIAMISAFSALGTRRARHRFMPVPNNKTNSKINSKTKEQ